MHPENSNCMVDNTHLENYVESILYIYYLFTKSSSHLTIMAECQNILIAHLNFYLISFFISLLEVGSEKK